MNIMLWHMEYTMCAANFMGAYKASFRPRKWPQVAIGVPAGVVYFRREVKTFPTKVEIGYTDVEWPHTQQTLRQGPSAVDTRRIAMADLPKRYVAILEVC